VFGVWETHHSFPQTNVEYFDNLFSTKCYSYVLSHHARD